MGIPLNLKEAIGVLLSFPAEHQQEKGVFYSFYTPVTSGGSLERTLSLKNICAGGIFRHVMWHKLWEYCKKQT